MLHFLFRFLPLKHVRAVKVVLSQIMIFGTVKCLHYCFILSINYFKVERISPLVSSDRRNNQIIYPDKYQYYQYRGGKVIVYFSTSPSPLLVPGCSLFFSFSGFPCLNFGTLIGVPVPRFGTTARYHDNCFFASCQHSEKKMWSYSSRLILSYLELFL